MRQYVYGIDIGGTTVKIGLFNQNRELIRKWEIPTRTGNNGEFLFFDIQQSIILNTALSEVIGYGFGIPGPVIHNFVDVAVNLGLENVDLYETFKELLDNEHIYAANDANVAALGEALYGAGQGEKDVVMLTLGTGVGSGFVVDSNVVEGEHGCGGEIGHLFIDHEFQFECNCGHKGCLETVASATGIRNLYYEMKKEYHFSSSLDQLKLPSAKAIFEAAKENDELACKVVDKAAYYLGYACSVVAITTNPSTIVFGGGVSKAGSFLIDKITDHFKTFAFGPSVQTKIVEAKLGNDAGMYGAMQLVINNG
jgi:glucokinase